MKLLSSAHDLKTLVLSFHPLVVVETLEEERVETLLAAVARELEMPLFEWTVTRGLSRRTGRDGHGGRRGDGRGGGLHGAQPPLPNTSEPLGVLRHLATLSVEAIFHLKDFGRHLESPTIARQLREATQRFARHRSTLVLTGNGIALPPEVEPAAAFYSLELPGRSELRQLLNAVLTSVGGRHRVRVDLLPAELEELIKALGGLTLAQARQTLAYCLLEDGRLDAGDIPRVLDRKTQALRDGGLLDYYPAAENRFELGGFRRLKGWLERARVGFSAAARELALTPPRGLLLVGVQGCGKSLAAKVIASEWEMPLLKLDAGRLYDKYVGETEKNFRRATRLAEGMAPAVLWIDEIEKGFAPDDGGNGGVSRRLFGSFLTWLQEKSDEVFVVATANDLSALPPEMLRKGRFDEIFFVDLPAEPERRSIFEIHLRLRKQEPSGFDLERLAAVTEGFSGAEIEQVVIGALYRALHQRQALADDLLLAEAASTVPLSVSRREEISHLRAEAARRFVSVH